MADSVCIRVSGAVADLHAADAQYHSDCYKTFVSPMSIKAAANKCAAIPHNEDIDNAFEDIQAYLGRNMTQVWNSVELHKVYLDSNGQHLTRRQLIEKLAHHFEPDLVVLSGNGVASIVLFRSKASHLLKLVDEEENADA